MSQKFPVLVLHGFTSSLDCIKKPAQLLEEAGFPVLTPILRGHGTQYQDLVGVKAQDWFDDAKNALIDLNERYATKIAVVGHSMGGVVALDLAIQFPDRIRVVIGAAPALEFCNPLSPFAGVLAWLIPTFPSPNAFVDQELRRKLNTNYLRFPSATFAELFRYAREVKRRLPQLTVPVHLMHSLNDTVVPPSASRRVLEHASSSRKSVTWYSRCGHEMFLDIESDAVAAEVRDFLLTFDAET